MIRGEPVTISGTAGATPTPYLVLNSRGKPTHARRMTVVNKDGGGVNHVLVSFDDGATYVSALSGKDPLVVEAIFNRIVVKSAAGAPAFEAILTVA